MTATFERKAAKSGLAHRLYHGETSFDFVGRRWRWYGVSLLVIVIGLISVVVQGLNFGIDFKGGTSWEVRSNNLSISGARNAVRSLGLGDAKIQKAGSDVIIVQADLHMKAGPAKQKKIVDVRSALSTKAKVATDNVSITDVGPSWGGEISKKAERALVLFLVAILIYISIRFEPKMAIAAIVAVIHDVLITVGVYSLSRFQVTPATVIAVLTILGYSLYDTVVVFDKVEENTKGLASSGRLTYSDTVNLSMNQVLMRSINTSLVAIMPVLSILLIGAYVLGATTLEDFGLALAIGLLAGAYSSIFIASPILAALKEREPRYATIRQRLQARGATGGPLTPAAAAAASGGITGKASAGGGRGAARDERPAPGSASSAATGSGTAAARPSGPRPGAGRPAPRPRKNKKKRR